MSLRQFFRLLRRRSGTDHRRPPKSSSGTDPASFDRSNLAVGYGPGGAAGYERPEPTSAPSEKPLKKEG